MKLCKVTITKSRNAGDTHCSFTYPSGYNAAVVKPFIYENQGNETEHCVAQVPDDFTFTDNMVELTQQQAETLVDDYVDTDRDLPEDQKETFRTIKKAYCS